MGTPNLKTQTGNTSEFEVFGCHYVVRGGKLNISS